MKTDESLSEQFWNHICAYKPAWFALLGVEAVLIGLIFFSLIFGTFDRYTQGIMAFNLIIVGSTTAACLYVVYRCSQRGW